jgi:hypothetical protein
MTCNAAAWGSGERPAGPASGCAGPMAQEFGDPPDAAASLMRRGRQCAQTTGGRSRTGPVTGADQRSARCTASTGTADST